MALRALSSADLIQRTVSNLSIRGRTHEDSAFMLDSCILCVLPVLSLQQPDTIRRVEMKYRHMTTRWQSSLSAGSEGGVGQEGRGESGPGNQSSLFSVTLNFMAGGNPQIWPVADWLNTVHMESRCYRSCLSLWGAERQKTSSCSSGWWVFFVSLNMTTSLKDKNYEEEEQSSSVKIHERGNVSDTNSDSNFFPLWDTNKPASCSDSFIKAALIKVRSGAPRIGWFHQQNCG